MPFIGYGESIRGASHVSSDRPCQDSNGHLESGRYALAVVSDGHGGSSYPLSDRGSRFVVESVEEVIGSCFDLGDPDDFEQSLMAYPDRTLDRMVKSIILAWNDKVSGDWEAHPEYKDSFGDEDILRLYGSTMVAGVITPGYSFGFQIGDGELVLIDGDGNPSDPLEDDEDCVFNHTSSICGSNAFDKCRTYFLRGSYHCVVVCTDGLSTTFNSLESLHRYCVAAKDAAFTDDGRERLNGNLVLRSNSNTQDDVSISIVRTDASSDDGPPDPEPSAIV